MKIIMTLTALSLIFTLNARSGPQDDSDFQRKLNFALNHHRSEMESEPQIGHQWGTDADSAHSWDALHYHIEMEFFPPQTSISAITTITGVSNEAGLDSVPMHFYMGGITQVLANGITVGYTYQGDNFIVALDQPHAVGDTFQIKVSYSGVPPHISTPNSIGWMGILWGNVIYTYTDPEGARTWYPCFDKPFDKATYSAKYTLPQGWIMASNGHLDSTVVLPNQKVATYWNHPYQIETYLISIAASNYAQFSSNWGAIPLNYYVYPAQLSAAQYDFQPVPDMMQCYYLNFGDYPFEKYGMAEAPIFGGGGAMEHQTMTTLGNYCITGTGAGEFIITHELSHMWWGDAVSIIDWPHIWLSEGFASYSEVVWAEYQYGWEYALYCASAQQNYYMNWETPNNRHSIYDPPLGYLFSPIEYEKASAVLHMLRYLLGSDLFFQILQDYFDQYVYGNASTADFQNKCEELSGLDLDWFFQEWIYDEGYPIFEYLGSWTQTAPNLYQVTFCVSQTQEASLPDFQTYIDISAFSNGIKVHTDTVWIEDRSEYYQFEYRGTEPDSFVLDADSWILGQKVFRSDITAPALLFVDHSWTTEFLYQGSFGGLYLNLENQGLPVFDLEGSLFSDDPSLSIPYNLLHFGDVGFMQTCSNALEPVSIYMDSSANSHWAEFFIMLDWEGGDTTLYFSIPVGAPTILLVDDDNGALSDTSSANILDSLQIVYRQWEIATQGLPIDLYDYDAVIWSCGHSSVTLNQSEIDLLSDYLDGDGRLFLSGANIASELSGNSFLLNFLHFDFSSSTSMQAINGVPGDPVGNGLSFFINSPAADQDMVYPVYEGIDCFRYFSGQPCGIRYDGAYKVVTLAFAFEDIRWDLSGFAHPPEVVASILNWLGVPMSVKPEMPSLPVDFALHQNYPNPFNPATVIRYDLPKLSRVKLEIFNILGQRVVTLIDAEQTAGYKSLKWDATEFSNGLYIYKLEAKAADGSQNYSSIKKMILIK